MTDDQMTTLWLGAFRYYCGRMTYAVFDFTELLIQAWPGLPVYTQALIQRELEAEFIRDDCARAENREYRPLGHDCDRESWRRVRALWDSEGG